MENEKNKPNLFHLATSELSQDAFIAWLIQWADPQYKSISPYLNALGISFIKALIAKYDNLIAEKLTIHRIRAGRQRGYIDVWAEINDDIFIIIEDKINAKEQENQVENYTNKAKEYKNQKGDSWKTIIPIYLKTGNECINTLSSKNNLRIFLRQDFLKILPAKCESQIVQEFTENLQSIEDKTNSYLSKPLNEWDFLAIQGFYCDLQGRFKKATPARGHNGWSGWGYVPTIPGGFQSLDWHWNGYTNAKCSIYLQVASNCYDSQKNLLIKGEYGELKDGQPVKLNVHQMHHIYGKLSLLANDPKYNFLKVEKAGRFRGGKWVSIAKITSSTHNSFISVKNDLVDMESTVNFLFKVEDMISELCSDKCCDS